MQKIKTLTMKQENFCREYVLCGVASQAYKKCYDASKMQENSIWQASSELLANPMVKKKIAELKNDLENLLGINKATEIKNLMKIRQRCLQPEPKLVWVKNEKGKMEQVQEEDEDGNLVWQFDSAGANSAQDKIFKAMGYYAPKNVDITTQGEKIDFSNININFVSKEKKAEE